MPWLASVDAVVQSWYPGQADGDALATVLYGDADPGGRLPVTFGRTADQYPTAAPTAYPGTDGRARYGEGIFVGYRYFDDRAAEPLFPFGYGQSYATFEYADPRLNRVADGVRVTVRVRNTGDRRGRDVLQAYVGKTAAPVPTPPRELAGFERVSLGPGETTTLGVTVPDSAFDYYDGGWTRSRGRNRVVVGRSSRDRIGTFDVDV
jgi:beta-glucosidase